MVTFAGRYDEPLFRLAGTNVLMATNVTVRVYEADGTTEATLYTDRTKATTADNPTGVDSAGNLEFFADPGTYVLSILESGIESATNTVVVQPDPTAIDEWAAAGAFDMTAITYDATYTSVISTATVAWPDGSAGTFTATDINATWEAIDAFTVTHDDSGLTVTQPTVTRNAAGNVTTKPALTIA